MKYSKSAFPYLALLFIVLFGLPLVNSQAKKTQELVIKVEINNQSLKNKQVVDSPKETRMNDLLVMTSK